MKVVVALRKNTDSQARQYLAEQSCEIHKSRFDVQEPAIRNLIDGLYGRGIQPEHACGTLYWFLVEAPFTPEQWLVEVSVAICFSFEWYQQQTAEIRHLKGIAYCDAAAGWAKLLPANGLAAKEIQRGGRVDWRGLSCEKAMAPDAFSKSSDSLPKTAGTVKTGEVHAEVHVEIAAKNIRFKKEAAVRVADSIGEVSAVAKVGGVVEAGEFDKIMEPSSPEPVAIKKRGRPRKHPVPLEVNPEVNPVQPVLLPEIVEVSRSGAEGQSSGSDETISKSVSVNAEPKKRGRPRKVVAPVVAAVDPDEEQFDLFV